MRHTVGQPLPHESARGHVTGESLYTDDLALRFAGLLHAWPVQAPHAHARIISLITTNAMQVPGVVRVLTAADVTGQNEVGPVRHDEPLFPTEVLHHGQAVAFVLGQTEEAARKGAEQVEVLYEPLPAILSIEEALAAGSFHGVPGRLSCGDSELAFASSPHQLEGELMLGGQEHFYLETQASIAYVDEANVVMIHSSTQHPAETQEICAQVLGLPRNQVVVQALRMGGAFGGKEIQANTWAAIAALGAWVTRRPVRCRLNRTQDMTLTGKRHPFLGRFKVGFDKMGILLALQIDLYSDGGWSQDLSDAILYRALFHCSNAYFIPHVEAKGWVCKTHKTSQTAFRGFGGPQGMVMAEEIIDRVARTLGLPPDQVREKNFYQKGQTTHYGQPIFEARVARIWSELLSSSTFAERRVQVNTFNATSQFRKRGLAITPVQFGISFTVTAFNQAGALVLVYQDGTVQINHGGTEMGQGLHTKMAQIAADVLGVRLDAIKVMPTRTDKVPNTSATAASSGSDLNGAAVRDACETLRKSLTAVAARRFKTEGDSITIAGGQVFPKGSPSVAIPFADLVKQSYRERVQLFATGFYRTPGIHWDKETATGSPFLYFSCGAAVSEVEVDGLTGAYHLMRVDILHDVGQSLNPLVDIGQIEGGFAQGLGWLTIEELVWDQHGRLATQGASTYKLPSLAEIPDAFHVRLLPKSTEPGVVFGSKAVGEPPLMLAISVREALRDAVSAFGSGGTVLLASPATPEAVYWAVQGQRAALRPVNTDVNSKGPGS